MSFYLNIPGLGERGVIDVRVMPNGVIEGDIPDGREAILRVRPSGFRLSPQFDQLIIDRWDTNVVVKPIVGPKHRKFMKMVPAISGAFGHYQLTDDGEWKKVLPEALLKGCSISDVGGAGLHSLDAPATYVVDTQAAWAEIVYPQFMVERSIYKLLDQGYPNAPLSSSRPETLEELRNIMQEVLDR